MSGRKWLEVEQEQNLYKESSVNSLSQCCIARCKWQMKHNRQKWWFMEMYLTHPPKHHTTITRYVTITILQHILANISSKFIKYKKTMIISAICILQTILLLWSDSSCYYCYYFIPSCLLLFVLSSSYYSVHYYYYYCITQHMDFEPCYPWALNHDMCSPHIFIPTTIMEK